MVARPVVGNKRKLVTIVPPDTSDYTTGHGTKVYTPDGVEIEGITGAVLTIRPDEIISVTLECMPCMLGQVTALVDAIVVDDRSAQDMAYIRELEIKVARLENEVARYERTLDAVADQ